MSINPRKLEQIIAAHSSQQRLILRVRIVLAAAAGKANEQIAREPASSTATTRR